MAKRNSLLAKSLRRAEREARKEGVKEDQIALNQVASIRGNREVRRKAKRGSP